MTLEQFEELILNSPLKITMRTVFAKPRTWEATMCAKYDNLKTHHRHTGYGCLLGIYGYHIYPGLLDGYPDTHEAFLPLWEKFEQDFGIKFDKGYNPFSLTYWPEIKRASYLATQDDKERKKIALDVLRTMMNETKEKSESSAT